MQVKDVYRGSESVELIDDYGGEIRKARIAKGMDLEEFAASILEKKGTLAKIESNDLVPDDKMLKKLGEECTEIVIAAKNTDPTETVYEISDLMYHLMVVMAEKNITWKDVTQELVRRAK